MANFELLESIDFKEYKFGQRHLVRSLINGNSVFTVDYGPFQNCQIFVIGGFQYIFGNEEHYKHAEEYIKELKKLCHVDKNLCQIDVLQSVFEKIKDHVRVYSKNGYVNLTGSQMIQVLIKI